MPSLDERDYDVLYPRGRPAVRHFDRLRPVLVPASWLYRCAADSVARVRSSRRDERARRATVVSVGNLEVGGNGKTPLCLYLIAAMRERGIGVAYVSRGYKSRAERYDGVSIVADTPGSIPGGRWLCRDHPGLAAEVGDEGAMVAGRAPGVTLVFARDKARAVDVASAVVGDGVVVVDDAFQSWNVARDIDIVLLDARRPFGDGWILPAGTLREEPAALERADLLLFNGAANDAEVDRARETVSRRTGIVKPCAGITRTLALRGEVSGPVVSVCAVARPESFESMLRQAGCEIALALRYPDHHAYCARDLDAIRKAATRRGARVVITEKDRVKLDALGMHADERVVARLEVALTDETVLWKQVEPRIRSAALR